MAGNRLLITYNGVHCFGSDLLLEDNADAEAIIYELMQFRRRLRELGVRSKVVI